MKRLDCVLSPGLREDAVAPLPWIETRAGIPYFFTENGEPWTPVGQNDAISWPELRGLAGRRDLEAVERHLRWLKAHGVTCLRLMLEYAQDEDHYIERPVGQFPPPIVQLWDDLFALCERVGLYILLTPYDTFFMWIRWSHHPYNAQNGGPAKSQREWLTDPEVRQAIKARLAFASDRWGSSGALFAWDLWNEMHPAHGGDDPASFAPFIDDVSRWFREFERQRHGRAHLQTVSIFGPELVNYPELNEPIFRHPGLDFANTHLYEKGTIDDPADTVAPALAVGRLMRDAVTQTRDLRPVFDSEHGPIHSFKDKGVTFPESFDDECFRHMQWTHLASGGAGGGMRWPNRDPHALTSGMRRAQSRLAAFLPLVDWTRFRRRNLSAEIGLSTSVVTVFGCGDAEQAVVWLLRTDCIGPEGTLVPTSPLEVQVSIPGLDSGRFRVVSFDPKAGELVSEQEAQVRGDEALTVPVALATDLALAIRRVGD